VSVILDDPVDTER